MFWFQILSVVQFPGSSDRENDLPAISERGAQLRQHPLPTGDETVRGDAVRLHDDNYSVARLWLSWHCREGRQRMHTRTDTSTLGASGLFFWKESSLLSSSGWEDRRWPSPQLCMYICTPGGTSSEGSLVRTRMCPSPHVYYVHTYSTCALMVPSRRCNLGGVLHWWTRNSWQLVQDVITCVVPQDLQSMSAMPLQCFQLFNVYMEVRSLAIFGHWQKAMLWGVCPGSGR